MRESVAGRCAVRLTPEVARGSNLGLLYKRRILARRRELVEQIMARGVRRGELRADLDPKLAADMLVGPLAFKHLVDDVDIRDAGDFPYRLVDALLRGLAARHAESVENKAGGG